MEMRRLQNDGLTRQVYALQKSIFASLKMQQGSLIQIAKQLDSLNTSLNGLQKLQTAEALKMKSQININLAIAKMEDHLAKFRIELLSK
jgi:hypothetical protein